MHRSAWVLALALVSCGPKLAPSPAPRPNNGRPIPGLWFVELDGPAVTRGGRMEEIEAQRAQFVSNASQLMPRLQVRSQHAQLWNGLTVQIPEALSVPLRSLPGVKRAFPVLNVPLPEPAQEIGGAVEPELFSAVVMTGADVVVNTLGFDGTGVKVGIIDSGADYKNPDLGGCFGPGCRFAFGWDFVGDAYTGDETTGPAPSPDADPEDCFGHGTHVAGIVGAKGVVTGVAPGVTFGAYRVFGCSGSTSTDIIISAMERAFQDGMRVINLSLGSGFQWPEYPDAAAVDSLVAQGVVVVASQGNTGAPEFGGASPAASHSAIAAASADNTFLTFPAFVVTPDGGTDVPYAAGSPSPPPPDAGTFTLVRTGTVTSTNDACSALAAGSLAGEYALIRRGTCGFYTKAFNAQTAGALGMVLYNNTGGAPFVVSTSGNPAITIPVLEVTDVSGAALDGKIQAGPTTITFGPYLGFIANPTGGQSSSFSAWGPTPELGFKPDVTAPGGSIYSTWPMSLGGHATLSGTSMSSPHIAGAAALLLQARPAITAAELRALLVGTAVPIASTAQAGVPEPVQHQGAGLIRIDRAVQTPWVATPASLALGASSAGPFSATLTLTNSSATALSFTVSHLIAAAGTGSDWAPTVSPAPATQISISGATSVPAGSTATVNVTITADAALADGSLYGGWLVFTSGSDVLRVPYAGFKGDYQALPVLTSGGSNYPWLASENGSTVNRPDGGTWTLQNGDVPHLVIHSEHAARTWLIEAFDAATGKPWGLVEQDDFVPRGSSATNTFDISWDGTVDFDKSHLLLPNGTYVLKVSALKALADGGAPSDWDIWTSPPVTLDHP